MLRRVALVPFCCLFSFAAQGQDSPASWPAWFEAGASYSDDLTQTQGSFFFPFLQSSDALLFTQGIGAFGQDANDFRIALGARQKLQTGWNVGGWVAYDASRNRTDSEFSHISLGAEALSHTMDVRASVYIPIEDRSMLWSEVSGTSSSDSSGTTTVITTRTAHALTGGGFDIEVGGLVPDLALFDDLQKDGQRELRAYLGGYALDFNRIDSAVFGTRIRFEYRWINVIPALPQSTLLVDTGVSWDEVRDTEFEVALRLRIPLWSRPDSGYSGQDRRMDDSIDNGFRPFSSTRITTKSESTFVPAP